MPFKLLFADDDAPILFNCMRRLLGETGITDISLASTPSETLEKMEEAVFDFVFLDLSFSTGRKEGLDLIPQILKIAPRTDIIMTTSYAAPDVIATCMRLGASDYIVKDFLTNEEALRKCIEASIARSAKRKAQDLDAVKLAERVGASFAYPNMQRIYCELFVCTCGVE